MPHFSFLRMMRVGVFCSFDRGALYYRTFNLASELFRLSAPALYCECNAGFEKVALGRLVSPHASYLELTV
jgi:hypothetical protein